jgi:ectoine hydroxylase-related dioxygenase (phytanoyl-CoA dioxygenase family)
MSRESKASILSGLASDGFAVIESVLAPADLRKYTNSVDHVLSTSPASRIAIGSTSTRCNLFPDNGRHFQALFTSDKLLSAAESVIGDSLKLSSFHSRTVHPHCHAQPLHVDYRAGETRFPLLGFIYMVDDFHLDNGATRFVPGTHTLGFSPEDLSQRDIDECEERAVTACGPAGSLIVFNGGIWHGHGANRTPFARCSIQGAFIPRDQKSSINAAQISEGELFEMSEMARWLLSPCPNV